MQFILYNIYVLDAHEFVKRLPLKKKRSRLDTKPLLAMVSGSAFQWIITER
jgi:hypothetical protein